MDYDIPVCDTCATPMGLTKDPIFGVSLICMNPSCIAHKVLAR